MNDHEFDEVGLLRSLRSDGSAPTEAETARGLAALERGIAARKLPARRSRRTAGARRPRRAIWGAIGVVSVGTLVGIAVVTAPSPVMGPIASEDPRAQAVALLERSAEMLPDLQVGEGQFLRMETRFQQPMSAPVLEGGEAVTYITRENRVHYIPSDLAGAWIFRTEEEIPTEILLPDGDASTTQEMIDLITPQITLGMTEEQYLAGQFPLTPEGEAEAAVVASAMEADKLRRMNAPTDPVGLRSFLLDEYRLLDRPGIVISEEESGIVRPKDKEGNFLPVEEWYYAISEDEAINDVIFEIVSDELMPRELRAACLTLLTQMQGVTAEKYLSPSWSSMASALFDEPATVITTTESDGLSYQLIFDEVSASLVGTQIVLTERMDHYPGVEPGTVVFLQSLNTTVVDAVPTTETW